MNMAEATRERDAAGQSPCRVPLAEPKWAGPAGRESRARPVSCNDGLLLIDGEPRVLLCASLFPFRLARSQWRGRMEAVKSLGYQAIDVYLPWNVYETAPGRWDFSEENDIGAFLDLAAEIGLFVLARPGPYICSEHDGGGLPSWVAADPDLHLRQDDPAFLEAVSSWFDRVGPILATRQYGQGGTVLLVQVDNELDFFPCADPDAYLGALASMLRRRGVSVPIVACAGQGDLARAVGRDGDILPAVNLYPDDGSTDVEAQVAYYRRAFERMQSPFIVTETNRKHRTLKRLIGGGVRFAGPYLQVSGWNFGGRASVLNWGDPEAFMSPDYDFGGVIDTVGRVRQDGVQARRLTSIIRALGWRLAAGQAVEGQDPGHPPDDHCSLEGLRLAGGGRLVTASNLGDRPHSFPGIQPEGLPETILPPGQTQMLVRDLPLAVGTGSGQVGPDGPSAGVTLAASSGELTGLTYSQGCVRLELSSCPGDETPLWCALKFGPGGELFDPAIGAAGRKASKTKDGILTGRVGPYLTLTKGRAGSASRVFLLGPSAPSSPLEGDGGGPDLLGGRKPLHTLVVTLKEAEETRGSQEGDCLVGGRQGRPLEDFDVLPFHMPWSPEEACDRNEGGVWATCATNPGSVCCISTSPCPSEEVDGILVKGAADLVSVTCGDRRTAWKVCRGGYDWFPLDSVHRAEGSARDTVQTPAEDPGKEEGATRVTVTARVWGRANFEDGRLPVLTLDSIGGPVGGMAVTSRRDFDRGWLVTGVECPARADGVRPWVGSLPQPRCPFGSWSLPVWPQTVTYAKIFHAGWGRSLSGSEGQKGQTALVAALHIQDGGCRVEVRVNGRPVGTMTPLQPYLGLGGLHDGDRLEAAVHREWGEATGRMQLLTGHELSGWTMRSCSLDRLGASLPSASYVSAKPPLKVETGVGACLLVPSRRMVHGPGADGTVVRLQGQGLMATAFTDHLCLGRLVMPGVEGFSTGGGRGDYLVVPDGQGDLRLYLEATGPAGGSLDAILIGGPVDR